MGPVTHCIPSRKTFRISTFLRGFVEFKWRNGAVRSSFALFLSDETSFSDARTHAHTPSSIRSPLFILHFYCLQALLTWSLNLLCFSLLQILVHSACEWRGNELIFYLRQHEEWLCCRRLGGGKCNEEARVSLRWRWPPPPPSQPASQSSVTWFEPPAAASELSENRFMKMFNIFL